MIDWRIDKQSRVPLYLQLKERLTGYITTGVLANGTQLPGVVELARKLQINFDTVRHAYKELEKAGLVRIRRGEGSFVHLEPRSAGDGRATGSDSLDLKETVRKLRVAGFDAAAIRGLLDRVLDDLDAERVVIVTECNDLMLKQVCDALSDQLPVRLLGVPMSSLESAVAAAMATGQLAAVVTTGFHVNEVRQRLQGTPVDIDFVIMNMSPERRREIERLSKRGQIGCICRDADSLAFWNEWLKAELGLRSDLPCCTLNDTEKVERLFASQSVIVVSPAVFEEVQRVSPPRVRVVNPLDRIDLQSLTAVRHRLLAAPPPAKAPQSDAGPLAAAS